MVIKLLPVFTHRLGECLVDSLVEPGQVLQVRGRGGGDALLPQASHRGAQRSEFSNHLFHIEARLDADGGVFDADPVEGSGAALTLGFLPLLEATLDVVHVVRDDVQDDIRMVTQGEPAQAGHQHARKALPLPKNRLPLRLNEL